MLEDNEDDTGLILRVLRKAGMSFTFECVNAREDFISAISTRPDVILSDHSLPQFNSMEALKLCVQEKLYVPFILVTGAVSDEFAINCLHQGADDYILKSNLARLPSAIKRALRQRTLENLRRVARNELRLQNRELSKVNKELDNFVYCVSHNLRGPLASMAGLMNLARITDTEGKLSELHDMMESSMGKLDETIKEILDYSRNVRGAVECGVIDWSEMIETCFERLRYILKRDAFTTDIKIEADTSFCSDKARLNVIFHNLLSNCLLYHDAGRKLHLVIYVLVSPGEAMITIKDNGIGIEGDRQKKVFEMFYRGTESSKGAGLGLYVVKETVAKLDGKITLTSIKGKGTAVVVALPNLQSQ